MRVLQQTRWGGRGSQVHGWMGQGPGGQRFRVSGVTGTDTNTRDGARGESRQGEPIPGPGDPREGGRGAGGTAQGHGTPTAPGLCF